MAQGGPFYLSSRRSIQTTPAKAMTTQLANTSRSVQTFASGASPARANCRGFAM